MLQKIIPIILLFFISIIAVNADPTIVSITGQTTITEGQMLNLTITSTLADNGTNTFSTNAGFGDLFTTGATSAIFTWNTALGDAGSYPVTFTVADDNSSDTKSVTLIVNVKPAGISIEQATVALGNDNTARSNPDEDYYVYVSNTFTIKNLRPIIFRSRL